MTREATRRKLVRLLQLAYSGEKAAALAYQGHAASVKDPAEAAMIRKIENDERVWFLPMYFAGRLETRNVEEYDTAAAWAKEIGLDHFLPELFEMAAVEVEHEEFFLETIGRKAPPCGARSARG